MWRHDPSRRVNPIDLLIVAALALAVVGGLAHRGLMESAGHRENILRPEFTHVGIGVISAGPYGGMFTQLFLTP